LRFEEGLTLSHATAQMNRTIAHQAALPSAFNRRCAIDHSIETSSVPRVHEWGSKGVRVRVRIRVRVRVRVRVRARATVRLGWG